MAYNYNEQTYASNFLIPFTIANDCPQENCEFIYRIIINLKNNLFKETKHIQQINIHRNHLVHYLPVILLDRYQHKKHYAFTLTNEKGDKKIFFNFQNETSLSDMFKIFLKRHEESQDKTKLTAIRLVMVFTPRVFIHCYGCLLYIVMHGYVRCVMQGLSCARTSGFIYIYIYIYIY